MSHNYFYLLFLAIFSLSCDPPPTNSTKDEVTKPLAKNLNQKYTYSPIQEISKGVYRSQRQEDGLYFVVEKITNASSDHPWQIYMRKMSVVASNDDLMQKLGTSEQAQKAFQVIQAAKDPIKQSQKFLTLSHNPRCDVWIAYAAQEPNWTEYPKPIISVVIVTELNSPIVTHIGIFKNVWYIYQAAKNQGSEGNQNSEIKSYPRLSLDLHAYTAHVMQKVYDRPEEKKSYLVTIPLESMANIIKKSMDKSKYFHHIDYDQQYINEHAPVLFNLGKEEDNKTMQVYNLPTIHEPRKLIRTYTFKSTMGEKLMGLNKDKAKGIDFLAVEYNALASYIHFSKE